MVNKLLLAAQLALPCLGHGSGPCVCLSTCHLPIALVLSACIIDAHPIKAYLHRGSLRDPAGREMSDLNGRLSLRHLLTACRLWRPRDGSRRKRIHQRRGRGTGRIMALTFSPSARLPACLRSDRGEREERGERDSNGEKERDRGEKATERKEERDLVGDWGGGGGDTAT